MAAQRQSNHRRTHAGGTLILALALALASPAAALADPGTIDPSVKVTDPTGTTSTTSVTLTATSGSPTTVSATTTGTSATVTVPGSATTGSIGGVTAPSTGGLSTGSGPITTSQTVGPSGPGATSDESASTLITDTASPAFVFGRGIVAVDQGLNADVAGHEPTTRTSVNAGARAHAVLCLLAQVSVDPSRATLSSLCNGGPSTAHGDGQLAAANEITGTSVSAAPTLRAAACLLALVSSSAPRTIDARELASASLSTLCGGAAASTADAAGDVHLTEDRTGTDVSVAPIAAVAACLLANANAGTTTVAHLATLCGAAASPSMLSGGVPIQVNDASTGTTAGISPAASAALCLLVGALATIPSDPTDSSAVAALSTACGATTPTTTPSTITGSAPATAATAGGTSGAVSPSVDAALCLLAQAGVSVASSTAQLSTACSPGTVAPTTIATNGGAPTLTVSVGPGVPPQGGTVVVPFPQGDTGIVPVPQGGTSVAPVTPAHGTLGVNTPPRPGVLGLTGLPSTSTEMLGGFGLLLIALGTSLAMAQRRRR